MGIQMVSGYAELLAFIERRRLGGRPFRSLLTKAALLRKDLKDQAISFSEYYGSSSVGKIPNKDLLTVCLVTEELAGISPSGGIGAAFLELARELHAYGIAVDILYVCPAYFQREGFDEELSAILSGVCRKSYLLNPSNYVHPEFTPHKVSYSIHKWLSERKDPYDIVHFHDYKGLGFCTSAAKRQGLAHDKCKIVTQVHGPTKWALEANNRFITHHEQIRFMYMEKMSLEWSDYIVAPSAYILDWIQKEGYANIVEKNKMIISNCLPPVTEVSPVIASISKNKSTLIYFGRHEQRKGLRIFCAAIGKLNDFLSQMKVKVVFLGGIGEVNDTPSLLYMESLSSKWGFDYEIRTGLMRDEALTYIKEQNNPLVAICSPYENSPYAVFEIMNLGIPLICSRGGGAIELFKDSSYKGLIEMNHTSLADCVVDYIENRFDPPESLKTPSEIATEWIGYHIDIKSELEEFYCGLQETGTTPIPLVTVVIPTYNRPDKIYDAVLSILAQTYPRIELIIVDDGSNNYDAIDALREIEPIVKYSGGHVIYRENGYLGAARNTGLRQAKGEYICFLDDDDIALDCMISDLVKAIHLTKSDVVVAVNAYMELAMREKTITAPVSDQKPSYIPVGGAYGLAAIENCIGGATSIISTKVMKEIGGYSETYGVGHEDYELYTKLLSSGYKIEVCPKVHYYYEVGRPSMLSTTSISENFHRNFSAYSVDERSREMINMCIGQRIEQDKAGRISWIYRDRPQAEIRKFFQVWHSRIDGIKAFLELMRAEGKEKSSFYRALSEDIGDIQ